MSDIDYTPDAWVLVKIVDGVGGVPLYKVFAQWYGGYTGSDSWKLNSGIVGVQLVEGYYIFEGHSGSFYHCRKTAYRTTGYGGGVLHNMKAAAEAAGYTFEILDECDPLELDYGGGI